MRVLVTAASKHGSTNDIVHAIASALAAREIDADIWSIDAVDALDGYDAVVLGSASYMGHWLEPAQLFVHRLAAELSERPVWLFSSGPLGEPAKPDAPPTDAADMLEATGAREHMVFPGNLDKHRLGLAERAIVAAVKAPEGDYRPWAEIDAWAGRIADALVTPGVAVPA